MKLATITGRKIGKNRDGDKDRIILQAEIIQGEDTRTIELFSQAGEDNNPANGCRVLIIPVSSSYQIGAAVSDDLAPEVNAGEREIYSTDNPVTQKKARIKLESDGNIILNQGTKSAINYTDLNSALQNLIIALNSALATKMDGGGSAGTLTLDISAAEVTKVKL